VSHLDWVTISALATATGTLVLAIATFASVRSANRAARTAERGLLRGLRPLLFPSRLSDEPLKVSFVDQHWLRVSGGHGVAEVADDAVYLAMSLRNVGSGLAVLHGWVVTPGMVASGTNPHHAPLESFRRLTRDLYVPPGDVFFWQGALRDPAEPLFVELADAIREESPLTVELLYGDEEGGQRTVTRFAMIALSPPTDADGHAGSGSSAAAAVDGSGSRISRDCLATVARHWNIDRADPR
jgi:hypothetical protein